MHLSKVASLASSSFVRTILAMTQKPGIISFAGGLPDPLLFPVQAIQQAVNALFASHDPFLFQYGPTQGFLPLREALAQEYKTQNIPLSSDALLITTGSQQGLDLLCRTLLDPKEGIVVESPTYLAALQLFNSHQATLYSVPLFEDGPDVDMLEKLFQSPSVKCFYTIPTFHNPTGFTCNVAKRERIAALALKYDVWIIEDNPYGALSYTQETPPSYASLCPSHCAVLGTASKIVAPDFRLGWLGAPKEVVQACVKFKECTDLQSGYFFQRVLHALMTEGTLHAHQKHLVSAYQDKRDTMLKALQEAFGSALHVNVPKGGMFVWAGLTNKEDAMALFHRAIARGVAFVPGAVFFPDNPNHHTLRLNFTHASLEEIQEGVRRLKRAYEAS
jgi:2-aminoadipate transaminase